MYFTDTHTGRIDAFDFDIESGAVRMRWPFVQVEKGVGGPDGLTVDAEGGYGAPSSVAASSTATCRMAGSTASSSFP